MLHGIGETANITFSNITRHSAESADKDWIGVWSPRPAHGNYSSVSPTKYKYIMANSTGTEQLWLVNSRHEIVVAYFTGGLDKPVLRAESKPVQFENVGMAMHLHLSLTGNAEEMRFDWTSAQNASRKPWLRWGHHPNSLNYTVTQVSSQTTHSLCTTFDWRIGA